MIGEHLDAWGLGVEEAFDLARSNTLTMPERPFHARRGAVHLLSGESMFTHGLVLDMVERLGPAEGHLVGVPNRHEVVGAALTPDEAGFMVLADATRATRERIDAEEGPIHPWPWYVPPEGMGDFGERAEPISLRFGDDPADPYPIGIKLGPRVHELFADLGPAPLEP